MSKKEFFRGININCSDATFNVPIHNENPRRLKIPQKVKEEYSRQDGSPPWSTTFLSERFDKELNFKGWTISTYADDEESNEYGKDYSLKFIPVEEVKIGFKIQTPNKELSLLRDFYYEGKDIPFWLEEKHFCPY